MEVLVHAIEAYASPVYHPPADALALEGTKRLTRWLPVALASMTAKYHRELAMRAFNHFWCERVPDLKPTAGYPLDAKRFKKAISPLQIKLGIADDCLWRWR